MSDFQPGDVVCLGAEGVRGLVVKMRDGRLGIIWEDTPGPRPATDMAAVAGPNLRKLVVLDPQSAYDADLLASAVERAFSGRWETPTTPDDVNQMAKVLRFLTGEEDLVAEPPDFSAAVVDVDGMRWSRVFRGLHRPWVNQVGMRADWSDLKVSKPEQILSQGVALD